VVIVDLGWRQVTTTSDVTTKDPTMTDEMMALRAMLE
jgi:hypothetical protein